MTLRGGGALTLALAGCIACGSFLLFLVEPIIAKALLPWFGGAANVWATCLVFFQTGLLVGYALAHVLVHRLGARGQRLLLLILVVAGALSLPILPSVRWKPDATAHPALWVLGALATSVGLPYVLIATTSPLVQSWYARAFAHRSPYRLFALSNLTSMLALLCYPTLLEPWLGTHLQAYLWSFGYVLWAGLLLACAALVPPERALASEHSASGAAAPGPQATAAVARTAADAADGAPSVRDDLTWCALAALGSLLLITVTNHLTRDVAAIPLLWVVPLAVYLGTFIVSFRQRAPGPRLSAAAGLVALAVHGALTGYAALPNADDNALPVAVQIAALCLVLGGACLFCHGTLAALRPAPRHLTRFYLDVSLGGALGSIAIGIAAPALLHVDFDFELGMVLCAAMLLWRLRGSRTGLALGSLAGLVACACAAFAVQQFYVDTVLARRNFYGALRVQQWNAGRAGVARSLSNGVILHGTQFFAPEARRQPTEYYAWSSGVGRALATLQQDAAPHRIGVIGLGVGTLAAYGRRGDVIRFYEINPAVLAIARRQFSFLGDSPAHIEIALGDARLSLEREAPQGFDLLVVDAFSSDAIPVHLLTREALTLYLHHVKPHGTIAIHTSNRYVDLPPVIERLARAAGLVARVVESDLEDTYNTSSTWVLLARDAGVFDSSALKPVAHPIERAGARMWTDDFSDLIEYLR